MGEHLEPTSVLVQDLPDETGPLGAAPVPAEIIRHVSESGGCRPELEGTHRPYTDATRKAGISTDCERPTNRLLLK